MSTLKVNTLTDTAATKSVPIADVTNGVARVWVNFNGTGTVAIRASYNVTDITDNGTGDYTMNITNALPDDDYAVVACGAISTTIGSDINNTYNAAPVDVSTVRLKCRNAYTNTATDPGFYSVAIFR